VQVVVYQLAMNLDVSMLVIGFENAFNPHHLLFQKHLIEAF